MHSVTHLKELLETRGLAPRKSLGQNFLIDGNLARKLVDASGAGAGELVLEVGPGAGALTSELLERGCDVVACELDEGLADLVEELCGEPAKGSLTVVRGDCLDGKSRLNPALLRALGDAPFRLVANLPYNAATPLMMTLLLDHPRCVSMWVTIQDEVARRFMARAGSKEYGEISVIAQALASIERVATVPPSCFWPRPKVTSAMIGVTRLSEPRTADPRLLQRICRRLFATRRKQIGSLLKHEIDADFVWPQGVEPSMRAEALTVEQLETLAQSLERRLSG